MAVKCLRSNQQICMFIINTDVCLDNGTVLIVTYTNNNAQENEHKLFFMQMESTLLKEPMYT